MRRVRSTARATRPVVLALAATVAIAGSACTGSESPAVRKAATVFRQTIESSPDHAGYAVSIARESTAPQARQLLLDSINMTHTRTAIEAIRSLGDAPPEQARQPLQTAFSERRGAVKREAAVALARLGDEEAMAWLRQDTAKSTGSLNIGAMTLLAERGEREVIEPVLTARMGSDDPGTRNEAYAVLGEIGQDWATRLLLQGLDNEFGEQRVQAIISLGRCGDQAVAQHIESFINTQGLVFASIEALGELGAARSADALKRMAGHEQSLVRVYAAVALMKLGDEASAREMFPALAGDEDPVVRRNLADQLGKVEGAGSTETLVALARDPDKSVRVAAMRSLIGRSSPELSALFLEAAADPDYEVGTLALNALARTGTAEAVATLEPLLDDDNPYVAISAAHAILAIHGRASEPAG